MKAFLLLVTWFTPGQPTTNYRVAFNSSETCEAARLQVIKDAERAKQEIIQNHSALGVFVETPDGVRIEILEDKTQSMPIRGEHVHFWLTEAEIPKAQAWYAKTFGGKAGTRNDAPVVDIPGGQFRFAKADRAQVPTRGRVLDHFGVDVKDLRAIIAKIEGEGIKLDEPYRKSPTGSAITYITDPWGARIELVERAPLL